MVQSSKKFNSWNWQVFFCFYYHIIGNSSSLWHTSASATFDLDSIFNIMSTILFPSNPGFFNSISCYLLPLLRQDAPGKYFDYPPTSHRVWSHSLGSCTEHNNDMSFFFAKSGDDDQLLPQTKKRWRWFANCKGWPKWLKFTSFSFCLPGWRLMGIVRGDCWQVQELHSNECHVKQLQGMK